MTTGTMTWWNPPLSKGSSGHAVEVYQGYLIKLGLGSLLQPWGADGDFGNATHNATVAAQKRLGGIVSGVVDSAFVTRVLDALDEARPVVFDPGTIPKVDLAGIRFIRARNYMTANRVPSLIVLHSMEAAKTSTTAENCASWFAGSDAPMASCGYCVDDDSIIRCVLDKDVAYHAPGANRTGIGIEHAGFARQSEAEWLDPFSLSMLKISAGLSAALCRQYTILPQFRTAADMIAGRLNGVTTHYEVNQAFKQSTHTDPGKGFPIEKYLSMVKIGMSL